MKRIIYFAIMVTCISSRGMAQAVPSLTTAVNITSDNGLSPSKIYQIDIDEDGNLNMHTDLGRFVYDGFHLFQSSRPPNKNRHSFHKKGKDEVVPKIKSNGLIFESGEQTFLLDNSKIYEMETLNQSIKQKLLYSDIPLNKYNDYLSSGIYHKESGNYYFGSVSLGLFKIQVPYFEALKHQPAFVHESIPNTFTEYYSQAEYNNGKILINNFLICDDRKITVKTPIGKVTKYEYPYIRAANFVDTYGRLWYTNKTYTFIYSSGKVTKLVNTPEGNNVISIDQSGNSDRFYALDRSKYYLIDDDKISDIVYLTKFGIPKTEEGQYLKYCKEDEKLYLLTTKSVYCINPKENTHKKIQNLPTADYRIMSPLKDGLYFVGTNGQGYFITDGYRWVQMPLDPKGHLKYAHAALVDREGHVWISTNSGLFRARLKDLVEYVDNRSNNVFYYYYDKTSGFKTNEFNGGCQSPAIELHDGRFSFSSMDGLVQFDPQKVPAYFPKHPIKVIGLEIDGTKSEAIPDTLTLDCNTKEIKFLLSTPYYGHPYNYVMEYRLSEAGEKWKDISASHMIMIQNMPHGTTNIEIRVRSGFGQNDYTHLAYAVTKLPHYYQTKWFLSLMAMTLVLTIVLIAKWYNRYTIQKNIELAQLIAEQNIGLLESNIALSEKIKQNDLFQSILAHDIKSPLRFIVSNSKLLFDHWQTLDDPTKKENMSHILDSAKKIKSFVDETLLWIQIRNGELEAEKSTFSIREVLVENFDLFQDDPKILEGHISIKISCDANLQIHSDPTLISTMIRNLMANSIKFSSSGTITLFAEKQKNNKIVFGCIDEGKGMCPELVKVLLSEDYRGNSIRKDSFRLGFVIIKEIARLLGANLSIESRLKFGSKVSLTI